MQDVYYVNVCHLDTIMSDNLVRTEELKKVFFVKRGGLLSKKLELKACDGIDIYINRAETYGLVGESGCGKTTLGRLILRLIKPSSGKIYFKSIDISNKRESEIRKLRKHMQIVFQDPYSSLNPRMRVGEAVAEVLSIHKIGRDKKERKDRTKEIFKIVGLSPDYYERYPHEFSGGQRQRICIGRAIAAEPEFIVCDEPVSALDVSVQAQILNLFIELQEKFALSYLFISHDLSVVKHISDRVGVMYLGKIVEQGKAEDVLDSPLHPYTQALISCVPVIDEKDGIKKIILPGDVPSPVNIPQGCPFHPRCPMATNDCKNIIPLLEQKRSGHFVSCIKV
ncbi:MAG: oligopeptide/dipeptide ABC transporter ATP-binding protein [Candidatus Hydrogenedentota bacterium]